MRSSSRPASAKARSRRRGHVGPHRVRERIAQERRDVELRLPQHCFRVDRQVPTPRPEDVVVVEVAVDDHVAADVEGRVELARERDQVAALLLGALRLVEPPWDVVSDPAERPPAGRHSLIATSTAIAVASSSGSAEMSVPDVRAPAGVRAGPVVAGTVRRRRRPRARARPALVGLVVVCRRHLEDGVAPAGDVRVVGERERRPELRPHSRRPPARCGRAARGRPGSSRRAY